jgi:hypothetical protein
LYEVVDREVDAVLVPFRRGVVYIAIFFHGNAGLFDFGNGDDESRYGDDRRNN